MKGRAMIAFDCQIGRHVIGLGRPDPLGCSLPQPAIPGPARACLQVELGGAGRAAQPLSFPG